MTAAPAARTGGGPRDLRCPFCIVAAGGDTSVNTQHDIVRANRLAIALISPRWWPNNKGHVLVVSKHHYETLYDLPREHGHAVQDLLREVAIAIRRTYGCHGVSTRQHNEAAGGQDVWHFHAHAFPRYIDDNFYASNPIPGFASFRERQVYATKLRQHFMNVAASQ